LKKIVGTNRVKARQHLKIFREIATTREDIACVIHFYSGKSLEDYYRLLIDELRKNWDGIARKHIGQAALCGQIPFRLPINTVGDSIVSQQKTKRAGNLKYKLVAAPNGKPCESQTAK
jgi:hypothetical protein